MNNNKRMHQFIVDYDKVNIEQIHHQNEVIIIGGDHHNTLGVIRGLGKVNIKPYVAIISKKSKNSFVLKSKYVEKGWIFPSEELCLKFIFDNFSNNEYKPILISTSDSATSCLDLNYEKLIKHFFIPNGGSNGALTRLMNKEILCKLALEEGLNIPKSWVCIDDTFINEIKFPCIIKPIKSIMGSKDDIKIVNEKEELKQFYQKKNISNYLFQEYLDKEFEFQLIGCSLDGGEEVIIPGYSKIFRSAYNTNTGFLEYKLSNSLDKELNIDLDKCKRLIKKCKYTGLFSIEFIKTKEQINYFLEINFRNDGNAYAVTAAGVNLPYIFVSHFKKKIKMENALQQNRKIIVMPEFVDFGQVIQHNISFFTWLKDVYKTDCFLVYDKKDLRPFLSEFCIMIKMVFRKIVKIKLH